MEDRILLAASQEMNEHGLKFTMTDVALRLGISKKTLYRYFASKDALISGVVDAYIEDIAMQQQELIEVGGEYAAVLKAAILLEPRRVLEFSPHLRAEIIKHCPKEWAKILTYFSMRSEELVSCLECGKREGYVRSINTKVAACMLMAIDEGLFQKKFLDESNLTFADAFERAIDIFFYGIIPRK